VDAWTAALAVVTCVVLTRWKVSELWLIAAGALLGVIVRG
jgi:chromate transport protein ChrA